MRKIMPSGRQRAGVIVMVVLACLLYVAVLHSLPFLSGSSGQLVQAQFAQANQLTNQTPVRVGGVDVGKVERLAPGPDHTTIVVMRITQPGIVIHSDASAEIVWRTLLGGSMAVDLNPGSTTASHLQGPIPLADTSTQVDWDQFNSVLATPTQTEFQRMFAGMRASFGDPRGAGRTLHELGPAFSTIGPAAQALRGQDIGDLPTLIRTTGITAAAIDVTGRASLAGLVDGAQRTLAITAADHVALEQALALSPSALEQTRETMNALNTTLTRLDPLVARLRPAVRELAPTADVLQPMLARTSRVLQDSKPLLAAAPAALHELGRASRDGRPLLRTLSPTVARLNSKLIPFLNSRDDDTKLKIYESIGPNLSAADSATSNFDSQGWLINFDAGADAANLVALPCDSGLEASQLARCNAVNEVLAILRGSIP